MYLCGPIVVHIIQCGRRCLHRGPAILHTRRGLKLRYSQWAIANHRIANGSQSYSQNFKYDTQIATLNIMHNLSTEEFSHASPFAVDVAEGSFEGFEEEAAEFLSILLDLNLFLWPAKRFYQFLWRNCLFLPEHFRKK